MKPTHTRVLLPFLSLLASASLLGAQATTPTNTCRAVGGLPSIGVTADDGRNWAMSTQPIGIGQGSFGLAVLEARGEMVTEYQGKLYVSRTGGCSWRPLVTIGTSPLLLAGGGNQVYAWPLFSGRNVWRVDLNATPNRRLGKAGTVPEDIKQLAVDPMDDLHLRVVGGRGGIYESLDGGSRWTRIAAAPVTPIVYFGAFDPSNLDHIVIGMVLDGVITSFDGGATWTSALGLTNTGGSRNSFSGAVSPADPGYVFVESIDLDESSSGAPSSGKHVYVSSDGGLSFVPAFDQGPGVTLANGIPVVPHPTDASVVYVGFGSTFQMTQLFLHRYDHDTGVLSSTLSEGTPHSKVRAMAFAPGRPDQLVVGFEGP